MKLGFELALLGVVLVGLVSLTMTEGLSVKELLQASGIIVGIFFVTGILAVYLERE